VQGINSVKADTIFGTRRNGLAEDIGTCMTIVNKTKVFMDVLDLKPSPFEFHTANEELIEEVGQFYVTLQLGPVVLENF
jgi:hypothetical protein